MELEDEIMEVRKVDCKVTKVMALRKRRTELQMKRTDDQEGWKSCGG